VGFQIPVEPPIFENAKPMLNNLVLDISLDIIWQTCVRRSHIGVLRLSSTWGSSTALNALYDDRCWLKDESVCQSPFPWCATTLCCPLGLSYRPAPDYQHRKGLERMLDAVYSRRGQFLVLRSFGVSNMGLICQSCGPEC
jgi:hypothetical protein